MLVLHVQSFFLYRSKKNTIYVLWIGKKCNNIMLFVSSCFCFCDSTLFFLLCIGSFFLLVCSGSFYALCMGVWMDGYRLMWMGLVVEALILFYTIKKDFIYTRFSYTIFVSRSLPLVRFSYPIFVPYLLFVPYPFLNKPRNRHDPFTPHITRCITSLWCCIQTQ